MRILESSRSLREVELHLTNDEAGGLIDALLDCRDDLSNVGLPESHAPVSDGQTELTVFIYAAPDELEAQVEHRMSDQH